MHTSHPLLFTLNRLPQHGRVPKWYLWANVNYASVPKYGEHLTTKYAFGPPLNSISHAIEEDAPHRRDGSTPCLGDTRTSLLLVVVPHHEAKGLKAHWPSIGARKGGPREGERIESQSSALAMTKHVTRLPFRQLPPPPPGKWGGATTHDSGDPWTLARLWVLGRLGALSSETFARRKSFSPVHFSWRTQPPRHIPEWCA